MKTKEILNIALKKIEEYAKPSCVQIALSNGRGVDAKPIVAVGDEVKKGQIIAKVENDMLGTDVASSISGTVTDIKLCNSLSSNEVNSICIENDCEEKEAKIFPKMKSKTPTTLRKRLREAGVVGCGGAGFPAYAKVKVGVTYDYLIVTACVSDYFSCADLGVLFNESDEILKGILALKEIFSFKKIYIATNKFAKKYLAQTILDFQKEGIEFVFMPNKLGQGEEKLICKTILNYEPKNTFPAFDGILVYNIQTIQNIFRAVELGKPMTSRVITLYGKSLNESINCRVAIGAFAREVVQNTIKEKCEYEYYEEREEFAKEKYWELNDLRKEFKETKTEEFTKTFIEKRKEINHILFDFIKFEHLNLKYLRNRIQVNGNLFGTKITDLNFPIQKQHYSFGVLTKKESEKFKN